MGLELDDDDDMELVDPEDGHEVTLAEFIDGHSVRHDRGTASWALRFRSHGHDVLMLVVSGVEAPEILSAAAKEAGIANPDLRVTLH